MKMIYCTGYENVSEYQETGRIFILSIIIVPIIIYSDT